MLGSIAEAQATLSFVNLSGQFSKTPTLPDFAARTGLGKYYRDCRPTLLIA